MSGVFLRNLPIARPWSSLGSATISRTDWERAFQALSHGLDGGWPRFKSDHSGTVATGELQLGGSSVCVVVKRPFRTRASQWAVDFFRPARARRAWIKTWKLFVRGLPTEVPLLVLERRCGMVITDGLVVFERVPGETIEHLDLSRLAEPTRRGLFRAVGHTIRATESFGFTHLDAKTSNWIAFRDVSDAAVELRPVMLDCDGVRHHPAPGAGLKRFLKALTRHGSFRPSDAADVCDGYAPAGWPRRVRALCATYGRPRPTATLPTRAAGSNSSSNDDQTVGAL